MKENFSECLKETLKWEGGYSDHPSDPGGKTNYGVTWERYDQYRKDKGLPKQSVKLITKAEVEEIYKKYYWDAVNGDERPNGVDLVLFDFAVNSGPVRARRYAALVAKEGLSTSGFIRAYCAARLRFLRGLRTWSTFGKGWGRRVAGIEAKALSYALSGHDKVRSTKSDPLPVSDRKDEGAPLAKDSEASGANTDGRSWLRGWF